MKNFNVMLLVCDLKTMIDQSKSDHNEYEEGRYIYSVHFDLHDQVVDVHAQWPMVCSIVTDLRSDYFPDDFEVTCNLHQSDTEDDSVHIRIVCNKAHVALTCFLEHPQLVRMVTEAAVCTSFEDIPSARETLEYTSCDKLFNMWRELTGWLM